VTRRHLSRIAARRPARVPALVAGFVLGIVVAGCGSSIPPAGGPTPVPSPSAAGICPPGSGTCIGSLTPGPHSSISFKPTIGYTTPAGWRNDADLPGHFHLRPEGFDRGGIYVFRDPRIASQDETCQRTADPSLGSSVPEMVAWMTSREGLATSQPLPVTIGGLRGQMLELSLESAWTFSCPFADGIPTIPLIVSEDGGLYWAVAGSERLRLYLLPLPDGGVVVVDIDAFFGDDFAGLLAESLPIVESFEFRGVTP
jgi:hypothetical protein